MKGALKAAVWLMAGMFVVGVLWLSLPVFSLREDLAPPAIDERPPALPVPEEPIVTPPGEPPGEPPGGLPDASSADPFADWARIARSIDPQDYESFLRAHPESPFAAEAVRRLTILTQTAARNGEAGAIEPGSGASDRAEDSLRDQLRAADIAFNAPDSMMFRQTARIELALAPQSSGVAPESRLSEGLSGEIVTVEGVDYALRMQATLSGQDFEIQPDGPVARTILADRPTTWDWTVRPLTHGPDKPLTLRLEAVIERDGERLPPVEIETFSATILVEVTTWDRVVEAAKELSPLHATLVAVGGTAIGVLSWLWRLRRKPAPTPTQQVEVTHRFAGSDAAEAVKKPEPDPSVTR
jgi:hypothetical protein